MTIKEDMTMQILNVTDKEFTNFGRIIEGYEAEKKEIMEALRDKTPIPEGTDYVAEEAALQSLAAADKITNTLFGGSPMQFGWCNGHNTKLNCLEYHRSSEINMGATDFILLLAKREDIVDYKLDSSKVKAFLVPAGVMVEVYATALHYAPCQAHKDSGFQVLVGLPKGTNVGKPEYTAANQEDKLLTATNKWLLAHADSSEAKNGAWVGITGENIDIANDIQ
jgi:ureidoglycolate hydrolase